MSYVLKRLNYAFQTELITLCDHVGKNKTKPPNYNTKK